MVEVKLHDIGEGMTEADINTFLVKEGDVVKADDPLVEVQTDKMTAEIPAPKAGVVKKFLVQAGEKVTVGTTLLIIEEVDSKTASTSNVKKEQPIFVPTITKRILASPYTRKIARDNGINIESVSGTGVSGRITDEDVYAYIDSLKVKTQASNVNSILDENSTPIGIKSTLVPTSQEVATIPFRGKRKQIAKKMVHSLYTIPHCTHFEEIDVTELIQFRNELKGLNINISATAFFIKALSVALKEYPIFNGELDEENESIKLYPHHHMGVAVDTKDGLMVPVIRNVEEKSLKTIHKEMKELTQQALTDQLALKDMMRGTFTISNVGPLGGSIGATPIIQHPQVALISFHKTKKMPVVTDNDQIVIRSMMNISMSFDHRVADGATAVSFTNLFAHYIQNPKMLLLELI